MKLRSSLTFFLAVSMIALGCGSGSSDSAAGPASGGSAGGAGVAAGGAGGCDSGRAAGAVTGGSAGGVTGGGAAGGAIGGGAGGAMSGGSAGMPGAGGALTGGAGGATLSGGSGGTGGAKDAGVGGASGAGGMMTPIDAGACGVYPHGVTTGWADKPAACGPNCMRFRNYCPFPLWIHTGSTLATDDQKIDTGQSVDVPTPNPWTSKRAQAYKTGPKQGEAQFVEMHFANGTINYNVTYVDYFGLPVEVTGFGGTCVAAQHTTGCYMPYAEALSGCPDAVLKQGDRCNSAGGYCLNQANQSNEFCHRLDSAITDCNQKGLGCPALSATTGTTQAYACAATFYNGNPKLCAALNRGMAGSQADIDDKNRDHFYQKTPYSTYSKWLQCKCPVTYTFPYDDVYEQGGFRACASTELRVTWCPGDKP
jgi:hypothetical protein